MHANTHVGLHVMHLLLLPDFNQNWNVTNYTISDLLTFYLAAHVLCVGADR